MYIINRSAVLFLGIIFTVYFRFCFLFFSLGLRLYSLGILFFSLGLRNLSFGLTILALPVVTGIININLVINILWDTPPPQFCYLAGDRGRPPVQGSLPLQHWSLQ